MCKTLENGFFLRIEMTMFPLHTQMIVTAAPAAPVSKQSL